jgi:hypothetical protein
MFNLPSGPSLTQLLRTGSISNERQTRTTFKTWGKVVFNIEEYRWQLLSSTAKARPQAPAGSDGAVSWFSEQMLAIFTSGNVVCWCPEVGCYSRIASVSSLRHGLFVGVESTDY